MNQRTLVLCDLLALVPSLHSNSFFKVSYFFIQNRQHKRIHCKKLMFDFVDYFIGKSVVLHANTKDMKMDLWQKRSTSLGNMLLWPPIIKAHYIYQESKLLM